MNKQMLAAIVLSAFTLVAAFSESAIAQDAALEAYKRKDMPYQRLQIEVDKQKALARVAREDWCSLAQGYDSFLVSLKKTIEQRRYLCETEWCQISQSDLPRFKSLQDDAALEMRNAERRCR